MPRMQIFDNADSSGQGRISTPAVPFGGRQADAPVPFTGQQPSPAPTPVAQPAWDPGYAAAPAPISSGALYQPGFATGAPSGGGGGSIAPSAPATPNYGSMDDNTLKGYDSTFANQNDMYSAKLKKYVADYDAQTGGTPWGQDPKNFNLSSLGGSMGADYANAHQGIQRNTDLGLRGLSEDFANRGLVNSGLYGRDYDLSKSAYDRQGQNLDQGVRNQLQTLNFNRGNYETDNQANIAAARSDALARLSKSQAL
jgi:hypothetical protein